MTFALKSIDIRKCIDTRWTLLLVFIVALLINSLQLFSEEIRKPVADEKGYLRVAFNIYDNGVFSWGAEENPAPDAFFTPVYPFFLSTIMSVNPDLVQNARCFLEADQESCTTEGFLSIVLIQLLLASLVAAFIFDTVKGLSGQHTLAWLTLLLVLANGILSHYAGLYLTENFAFFFFYLLLWSLVKAALTKQRIYFFSTGLFLGLAALSRPSYFYLIPFLPLAFILYERFVEKERWPDSIGHACLSLIAAVIIILPWMTRNVFQIGVFAISDGYASFILVQRLAYNMMSWPEWFVSFIYWLPDFGDSWARDLFDVSLYERLNFFHPESYYLIGNGAFRQETLASAGGLDHHFSYLVQEYLLGDLFKHIAVTIPLVLRGMWVGKIFGLAGFLCAIPVLKILWREQRIAIFMLYLFPLLFMLGFNAFVSVSIARYNEPLIVPFSYIIAIVLMASYTRVQAALRRRKPT